MLAGSLPQTLPHRLVAQPGPLCDLSEGQTRTGQREEFLVRWICVRIPIRCWGRNRYRHRSLSEEVGGSMIRIRILSHGRLDT